MKIKANPYVYSFSPFENLNNKTIKWKIKGKKIIDFNQLTKIINQETLSIETLGNSFEEKIFNLFLNDKICFGPKKYLYELKDFWIDRISHFTKAKKPIKLSILGFPFKIPVLLKTNRIYPDLGELLSLKRLVNICQLIKKIYPTGAKVYVVTEEVFGMFNNMNQDEIFGYQQFLKELVIKMGWNQFLELISLSEMEKLSKSFNNQFQEKINHLERLYINSDSELMKKYRGAYPSLYHIFNTKRFELNESELIDLYNKNKKLTKNKKILKLRQLLKYHTHFMAIQYFAYLQLRDELGFFDKVLPNVLMLSVSPKKYRLGIFPINERITKLPYHGVVVYDKKENIFNIEYLIDLKRRPWEITEVFLKGDKEEKPFFYIKD
jgi:pyoverdine/dityrosine biosynthesis protein Dit1